MKFRLKSIEWESATNDIAIITLEWQRFWGLIPPNVITYRGFGHRWAFILGGGMASEPIANALEDIWTEAKWTRYNQPRIDRASEAWGFKL